MESSPQHYSATFKKLKSVLKITEILIFPGFLSTFHDIFKILNFHDISMTGKVTVIFPGFQGFPGAVATLIH